MLASNLVHVRCEVFVGYKVGVIFLPSCHELSAESGVLIDLKHINAGVRDIRGNQII